MLWFFPLPFANFFALLILFASAVIYPGLMHDLLIPWEYSVTLCHTLRIEVGAKEVKSATSVKLVS